MRRNLWDQRGMEKNICWMLPLLIVLLGRMLALKYDCFPQNKFFQTVSENITLVRPWVEGGSVFLVILIRWSPFVWYVWILGLYLPMPAVWKWFLSLFRFLKAQMTIFTHLSQKKCSLSHHPVHHQWDGNNIGRQSLSSTLSLSKLCQIFLQVWNLPVCIDIMGEGVLC